MLSQLIDRAREALSLMAPKPVYRVHLDRWRNPHRPWRVLDQFGQDMDGRTFETFEEAERAIMAAGMVQQW